MQGFFNVFYCSLLRPSAVFAKDAKGSRWQYAALTVFLVSVLLALSTYQHYMLLGLLINGVSALLIWWAGSLLLHFCADLFQGQGRFVDAMTATGMAMAPLVLAAPITALPNLFGEFGHTLSFIAWMGIIFWTVCLLAVNLSKVESFSLDRALGSLVLSGVFSGAFILVCIVLGMMQLFLWGSMIQA